MQSLAIQRLRANTFVPINEVSKASILSHLNAQEVDQSRFRLPWSSLAELVHENPPRRPRTLDQKFADRRVSFTCLEWVQLWQLFAKVGYGNRLGRREDRLEALDEFGDQACPT